MESKEPSKGIAALAANREARKLAGLPAPVRKTPLEKAATKPTSLRLAVNAKCFSCQGEDQDPGVRKRIRECSVTKCPLNPVRPYQRGEEDDGDGESADAQDGDAA